MKHLKLFFFGILIGISNLIPGFSGGTMALILGIYAWFTFNIGNVTKHLWTSIKELWSIGIGIALGIVCGTFTITKCLSSFPIMTSSFFVGLIIATIEMSLKEVKKEPFKLKEIIFFSIFLIISIALCVCNSIFGTADFTKLNVLTIVLVLLAAILSASTMIIPAASGSLILMFFNMYEPIINLLKDVIVSVTTGNFDNFLPKIIIVLIFIVGCVIGIVGVSKIISYLFEHKKSIVWSSILGLLTSSLFTIYYHAYVTHVAPNPELITNHLAINIILSVCLLVFGYLLLKFILKKANKTENNL